MKVSSVLKLKNKTQLEVISVTNPYDDYFTMKLTVDEKINWEAGEFGIFWLPDSDVKGKKWRVFSIASIKKEGFLQIGTRTGKEISSYKKHLTLLKKGEKVKMIGPLGGFKIKDNKTPIILIAGGIGITPIRSILKQLEGNNKRKVELIYTSKDFYLFEQDILDIASKDELIKLHLISSREDTKKIIQSLVDIYGNNAYYYISGSPKMVRASKKTIKSNKIRNKRIISDSFIGYK